MSRDNLADAMAEIQKMKKGIVEVQRLGEEIANENESLRARLAAVEAERDFNADSCRRNGEGWTAAEAREKAKDERIARAFSLVLRYQSFHDKDPERGQVLVDLKMCLMGSTPAPSQPVKEAK